MRKFFAIIAVIAMFSIAGCSTKFKIAAPYKNITVVWGLLDQADTAHYIRIEKAFLSNTLSAITMAQNYDSSYYNNLNVKIELVNFTSTPVTIAGTINLFRVNLDSEGYPKQPGAFFTAPNYAYKFVGPLNPVYSYRLVISNPVTGEVDSAETPVIVDSGTSAYINFYLNYIDDSTVNRQGLDFHSVVYSNSDVVSFIGAYAPTQSPYNFYGQSSPVAISEFVIGFNWVDSNILTGVKTARSSTDDLGFQTLQNNAFNYQMTNADMYSAVRSALGTAPPSTLRFMGLCSLTAYLSTPDYSTYQQIQSSAGTGLTGGEIEPIYTNMKGANVLGLFTSKGVRSGYIGIDYTTIDSMRVSPILSGTNLEGTDYNGVITLY